MKTKTFSPITHKYKSLYKNKEFTIDWQEDFFNNSTIDITKFTTRE